MMIFQFFNTTVEFYVTHERSYLFLFTQEEEKSYISISVFLDLIFLSE